jgi:hypothetical protein
MPSQAGGCAIVEHGVRVKFPARPWGVLTLGCLLAALACGAARAAPAGERYFIDFRSRASSYIGHTFIVYFRVDADGRVTEQHYAGLIPDEDGWKGLLAPIRGSVRKYKDDATLPPSAIYRRRITAAEYRRVARVVHTFRGAGREWHAVFLNCNDFGTEIAEALGLRRPPSLLPPSVWVHLLKAMNR